MNILVRSLSKYVTEEQLKSKFSKFGTVSSVIIVYDERTGQSKGFGFVEMPDQTEAEAAIKALHFTKILKNKIRVKVANPESGSDKISENSHLKTETERPSYVRTEKPGFKSKFSKPLSADRRDDDSARFTLRDGIKPDYKARDEGPYIPRRSRVKGSPLSERSAKRDYNKPSSEPREERSSGYQGSKERNNQSESRYSSREGNRPEHKPGAERPSGPSVKRERNIPPREWYAKRVSNKPNIAPREERSSGYQGSKERNSQFESRNSSRDGNKLEYKPRVERPYSPRGSRERSIPPSERYAKRDYNKSTTAPQGERSFGDRGSARPEYKTRVERPSGPSSSRERSIPPSERYAKKDFNKSGPARPASRGFAKGKRNKRGY